jgi:L-seryl-tRNA(Ser) seleniumtransferase
MSRKARTEIPVRAEVHVAVHGAPSSGASGAKSGAAVDRFGNPVAFGLPYARGQILPDTAADIRKLRHAWRLIEQRIGARGPASVFNFSGLERSLSMPREDHAFADDELAGALYQERLKTAALKHLGGTGESHDIALFNRLTAATFAVHLALVDPGDAVIGVTPTYSHPTVSRAARQVGARFVDTQSVQAFAEALEREQHAALVVLTRLAVTYDLLPLDTIRSVVRLAQERRVRTFVDDAGGARVGPAVFDQPRMLELGVDLGATGLDKYGTTGPRLGLLAGEKELVGRVYARACEFGLEARPMLYPAALRSLEAYTPQRVRLLVTATKELAAALRETIGNRIHETPVTAQLPAEDILQIAIERGGIKEPPLVPYEATAALAMLLLRDYGVLTVHLAALPPGTSSLLFKFIPPETLSRFGGAEALARAVNSSLSTLGGLVSHPADVRALLLGDA